MILRNLNHSQTIRLLLPADHSRRSNLDRCPSDEHKKTLRVGLEEWAEWPRPVALELQAFAVDKRDGWDRGAEGHVWEGSGEIMAGSGYASTERLRVFREWNKRRVSLGVESGTGRGGRRLPMVCDADVHDRDDDSLQKILEKTEQTCSRSALPTAAISPTAARRSRTTRNSCEEKKWETASEHSPPSYAMSVPTASDGAGTRF